MRIFHRRSAVLAVPAVIASAAMTCHPPIKSTLNRPPTAAEMAQLCQAPKDLERRDPFHGVGGARLAPAPHPTFTFKAKDTSGYSPGYDVEELLRQIRTQDVSWTTRLLSRLTQKQKRDAFRAAAYPDDVARRFIARLDSKISDGLKLCVSP